MRRRELRYIGFDGMGHQSRDVLHINDLAALIARQISRPQAGFAPLYTVGGGRDRAMSLRQLTAWCDARFGANPVASDPTLRLYDIPWFITDARRVQAEFDWMPHYSLDAILTEIADHAEAHPQWLEWSGA